MTWGYAPDWRDRAEKAEARVAELEDAIRAAVRADLTWPETTVDECERTMLRLAELVPSVSVDQSQVAQPVAGPVGAHVPADGATPSRPDSGSRPSEAVTHAIWCAGQKPPDHIGRTWPCNCGAGVACPRCGTTGPRQVIDRHSSASPYICFGRCRPPEPRTNDALTGPQQRLIDEAYEAGKRDARPETPTREVKCPICWNAIGCPHCAVETGSTEP